MTGCSCAEVQGENPSCPLHGISTDWALANNFPDDWQSIAVEQRDEITHLRAELALRSEAPGVWQPIESAPKDGERLNLCWKAYGGLSAHVELGKFSPSLQCWTNTYGKAFGGEPDFFMPLPPPPTQAQDDGAQGEGDRG